MGLLVCVFNDQFTFLAFIGAESVEGVHSNGSEIRKQIKERKVFLKPFPRFP